MLELDTEEQTSTNNNLLLCTVIYMEILQNILLIAANINCQQQNTHIIHAKDRCLVLMHNKLTGAH